MTKKDYIIIANAVRRGTVNALEGSTDPKEARRVIAHIVSELVLALGAASSRFNYELFQEACRVSEESVAK